MGDALSLKLAWVPDISSQPRYLSTSLYS